MKIGVVGSMQFTEQLIKARDELIRLGHEAFTTSLASAFWGKSDSEKEAIKLNQKKNLDPIREFWNLMQGADAILVMNFEKGGVENYIGGNTLIEIGFAHVLGQKIFLLNPIPKTPYCKSEIEALRPIVIDGDLKLIK